ILRSRASAVGETRKPRPSDNSSDLLEYSMNFRRIIFSIVETDFHSLTSEVFECERANLLPQRKCSTGGLIFALRGGFFPCPSEVASASSHLVRLCRRKVFSAEMTIHSLFIGLCAL